MPKATLVCSKCKYTARRELYHLVVACRDIEQHSPFRKEWLLSPKLFRYDFTDPYGRW